MTFYEKLHVTFPPVMAHEIVRLLHESDDHLIRARREVTPLSDADMHHVVIWLDDKKYVTSVMQYHTAKRAEILEEDLYGEAGENLVRRLIA